LVVGLNSDVSTARLKVRAVRQTRRRGPRCWLRWRSRYVAVETDDQSIASGLGLPEQRYMSGVQQIETTICEADLEPLTAPPLNQIERICPGQYLV